jgi:hypothetical protein
MRLLASGTILLTMVCSNYLFAQAARPEGSYTATCQNIRMKGSTLYADCQSADGKVAPAKLENATRCSSGVINLNGILSCQSGIIPPGSYLATCNDLYAQGTTLRASCKNDSGKEVAAEMRDANQCTGDIVNKNGSLRCVATEASPGTRNKRRTKRSITSGL